MECTFVVQASYQRADFFQANGNISDLLEEAMDDTVSEQSVLYVARKVGWLEALSETVTYFIRSLY